MILQTISPVETGRRSTVRWSIAFLVSAAIAISYLDRQTLPWAIKAIQADIPFSNQLKAGLDSAFLVTYGLMYVGGGMLLDKLGTRRGFFLYNDFLVARVREPRSGRRRDCARGEPFVAGHG